MKIYLKKLTAGLCAALALLTVSVFAHGGHHGGHHYGQTRQTTVSVCQIAGCSIAGHHSHNGVSYCGYAHEGGFCDGSCRALCPMEDCAIAGAHSHNGVSYCGYAHESGFCDGSCRALCTVEGCTIAGAHSHNGVAYCGYAHAQGFCDGIHGGRHGCRR